MFDPRPDFGRPDASILAAVRSVAAGTAIDFPAFDHVCDHIIAWHLGHRKRFGRRPRFAPIEPGFIDFEDLVDALAARRKISHQVGSDLASLLDNRRSAG